MKSSWQTCQQGTTAVSWTRTTKRTCLLSCLSHSRSCISCCLPVISDGVSLSVSRSHPHQLHTTAQVLRVVAVAVNHRFTAATAVPLAGSWAVRCSRFTGGADGRKTSAGCWQRCMQASSQQRAMMHWQQQSRLAWVLRVISIMQSGLKRHFAGAAGHSACNSAHSTRLCACMLKLLLNLDYHVHQRQMAFRNILRDHCNYHLQTQQPCLLLTLESGITRMYVSLATCL